VLCSDYSWSVIRTIKQLPTLYAISGPLKLQLKNFMDLGEENLLAVKLILLFEREAACDSVARRRLFGTLPIRGPL
jgi:hypothetical protein